MTTQLPEETKNPHELRNRAVAGAALIIIGAVALIAQFADSVTVAMLVMPTLALIFLIWGLVTRTFGLIIPGGILAGLGLGTYLTIAGPLAGVEEPSMGGIILVCFAGGWLLISLLSPLTGERFQWWPLIPGGILGIIGLILLGGGPALQVLKVIGYAWPLALVALGIYLLVKRQR